MRPLVVPCLAGLGALTACAGTLGPTADRPCFAAGSTFHGDDQNPVMRLAMLNVGRWCAVGVRVDGRAAETVGAVVEQPGHGRARVRRVNDVARAEYLPAAGFTGEDSFRARIGPGSQVYRIDVSVRASP